MKIKPHFFIFFVLLIFFAYKSNYSNTLMHELDNSNSKKKTATQEILSPPFFSHDAGFYNNSIELVLYHFDPETVIVYTIDGSEPCIENIGGTSYYFKNNYPFYPDIPWGEFLTNSYKSEIFGENLIIKDNTNNPNRISTISSTVHEPNYIPVHNVYKGNIIRAKAYKEGYIPSETITKSYFISPEGHNRFSLPVISISIQENYLFDYEIGIYTAGIDADKWRENNPEAAFSWPFAGNFRRRGDEFEYPAHFEFFETDKSLIISQGIGIRIHGGGSRAFPMKSLRLYARNIYGNSHLNHNFFNDSHHNSFKRLLLRNSGNDFPTDIWEPNIQSRTMFRDAAIQTIFNKLNFDTQAYRPAVVFINGEYWGIHNIRERYDKHYLERNYNVNPDSIDLLTEMYYVVEGDNLHYIETIAYIQENGIINNYHYNNILTRVDEKNFADYQIANIFARNTDWPGNNIDYWRKRTNSYEPNASYGHDGRWRWLMFDLDFGFGLRGDEESYLHNTLEFATEAGGTQWPNPDWSTFLLRNFLENNTFKHYFITRFADLLNSHFLPDRTISVINEIKSIVEPEIEEHLARWAPNRDYQLWLSDVKIMIDFASLRPDVMFEQLIEYFDIDGLVNIELDVNNQLKGTVRINTININSDTPGINDYPYPWTGKYFKNIPVEVEAIPAPGYKFVRWEGFVDSTSEIINISAPENIFLKAIFEKIDENVLMHYWFFDYEIPNNTPLENIGPFFSIMPGADIEYVSSLNGYPFHPEHPLWRIASMERRNNPTPLNYRPEVNYSIPYSESEMRGLQIKQPFVNNENENTMILHLPTIGFSDIVLGFAVTDENAADYLIVDYSTCRETINWKDDDMPQSIFELSDHYQYIEISFKNLPEATNNPYFKVRFRFNGEDMSANEENRVTFNNISLEGVALGAYIIESSSLGKGQVIPEGNIPVYEGGNREFLVVPEERHRINKLLIDEFCQLSQVEFFDDGSGKYEFVAVNSDHSIKAFFALSEEVLSEFDDYLVIFPNPANEYFTISTLDVIEKIEVYYLQGQKIYSYESIGEAEHTINSSHYQNGFYIIVITTEKGIYGRKLNIIR